jgi:hypothetical protein
LLGLQALLLAGAAQFSIDTNVRAQSVDLRAKVYAKTVGALAEAKAEAARRARALAYPPVPQASGVGNYTVFDVPGATGTFPISINLEGTITGQFPDANGLTHGFLRAANGAITTFDAPAADQGTFPQAIDLTGDVTGSYCNATNCYGFLRAAGGVTTTFEAPGAVNGTTPAAISLFGEIGGYFYDASFVEHGFIRALNGNIVTFDAPGAGASAFQGTLPLGIGGLGTIAGIYVYTSSYEGQGFLLAPNGAFTEFDAPGTMTPYDLYGDTAFAVNPEGVVTGAYFQSIAGNPFGGNFQVFIRALNGTITTFATGSNTPCCTWSWPTGINLENAVVGTLNDGYNVNHGFLRASNGSITTFDAPGAGTGFSQGTIPLGITALGEIMGRFKDSSGAVHGFTLAPGWSALSAAK